MLRLEVHNTGPCKILWMILRPQKHLDIFSDKLERALRRQKQEIVNELNLTSKSTEKKVPDFKFQSNKIQFEFNSDREHDILKAVNLLKSNNVESDIDALNSVVKDLNKRNKFVRIADKYGWDVVQEYQMTLLLMMLTMLLSLDKLFLEQRKETTTGSLMSVTTVRILDKIRRGNMTNLALMGHMNCLALMGRI